MIYKAIKLQGEAVRVNGVLVWPCAVVDAVAEIVEGSIITRNGRPGKFNKGDGIELLNGNKGLIICTIGVNLEGVEMAVDDAGIKIKKYADELFYQNHPDRRKEMNVGSFMNHKEINASIDGFEAGYNSRECFTREDMIKCYNSAGFLKTAEEYVDSLSLPREISEVELNGLEIIKIKYK